MAMAWVVWGAPWTSLASNSLFMLLVCITESDQENTPGEPYTRPAAAAPGEAGDEAIP